MQCSNAPPFGLRGRNYPQPVPHRSSKGMKFHQPAKESVGLLAVLVLCSSIYTLVLLALGYVIAITLKN